MVYHAAGVGGGSRAGLPSGRTQRGIARHRRGGRVRKALALQDQHHAFAARVGGAVNPALADQDSGPGPDGSPCPVLVDLACAGRVKIAGENFGHLAVEVGPAGTKLGRANASFSLIFQSTADQPLEVIGEDRIASGRTDRPDELAIFVDRGWRAPSMSAGACRRDSVGDRRPRASSGTKVNRSAGCRGEAVDHSAGPKGFRPSWSSRRLAVCVEDHEVRGAARLAGVVGGLSGARSGRPAPAGPAS